MPDFNLGDDFGYDDSWQQFAPPGDNIDAGGGWNPAAGYDPGDNIDAGGGWNPLTGQAGAGGSIDPAWLAGGGGGGFDINKILRSLGLSVGKGENASSLLPILSLLGLGGSALISSNASNKAANLYSEGAEKANAEIRGMMSGAKDRYAPYAALGAGAASALPGLAYKPLAGNFKPLGSGAALNLGNIMQRGKR